MENAMNDGGDEKMKKIELCGVRIDALTLDGAVEEALRERGETCTVVTPNALMLERCRRDRALATVLNRATLSLPDGKGVLLAAKRMKKPLPMRVSGIDFGERLMQRAADRGLRVFLLGAEAGVGEIAAHHLEKKIPKLCICGTYHGYFDRVGVENERILSHIERCRADILFVCMGFPAQEEWIFSNLDALRDVRVVAGLGGSLDVWAGKVSRAPKLIQIAGLKWLWRTIKEPKRARIFFDIPVFLFKVRQSKKC